MKNTFFLVFALSLATLTLTAQTKKEQDQKAIKSMCGCYEVTFNFAETFNYASDSTYVPSPTKHDKALEWVELLQDDSNKIVMQHLLIVGPADHQQIVKHWRQDWEYENTDFYVFNHDNNWKYVSLPKNEVSGQWTQKVFQVDDSPRYEGSATWIHVDGKSYWENTTDAPLPRREYTIRNDYNVTKRSNRHEITENGWIHEQDNGKVLRKEGSSDILIAQEKGYNTYVKTADSRCKAAQEYWAKNQQQWATIRAKWETVFNRKKDLTLADKVNNKPLAKYFSAYNDYTNSEEISKVIESFVK